MSDTDPISIEPSGKLEFDLSRYMPLFEDESVSDADKMALLEALWSIMMSFVQIGWGVHPVQQARSSRQIRELACGQQVSLAEPSASSVLDSDCPVLTGHFDNAAGDETREVRRA